MPDILIRGMEMPDSCSYCPMCYDMIECTVSPLQFWHGRPENEQFDFCHERHPDCPLVELPEQTIETNIFDECERHDNCAVEVWRNSVTGEVSVGWWPNEEEGDENS